MSPLGQKLASTWLREKAMDLRTAASRADKAYSTGGGYEAARYVADKYRKAVVLLDDAATVAEDTPLGTPGVRDPDHPCDMFSPGKPTNGGCQGDGHHLCGECSLLEEPQ